MTDLQRDIDVMDSLVRQLNGWGLSSEESSAWQRLRARIEQAPPAAAVPEVLVRAYFHRFSEVEDDYTIYHTLDGVCEQCIPVLIVRGTAAAIAAMGETP